jgi:hypothetical protein
MKMLYNISDKVFEHGKQIARIVLKDIHQMIGDIEKFFVLDVDFFDVDTVYGEPFNAGQFFHKALLFCNPFQLGQMTFASLLYLPDIICV